MYLSIILHLQPVNKLIYIRLSQKPPDTTEGIFIEEEKLNTTKKKKKLLERKRFSCFTIDLTYVE